MIRLLALLLALSTSARAQQGKLLDPAVRDLLHEELSGEIAKEHVIGITRFHRIQGSRGYHEAAEWVLARLRAYGFDEEHAWIETYPSDGKIHYQTWQAPSGWHVDSAELRMLEPRDERIVAFPEIAMSLVTYSNPGDVTAELVWVGDGTRESDYAGKDVKGKLVLATGYGGAVHRQAVLAHGAAAVVCYLDDERAAEHPDMLQYTGMWPKPDELERTTFGFNLTNRQGEALRALLEAGKKVVLRGKVEGVGLEPFAMSVVVAKIDGTTRPQEELLFSAHLDHPKESANDNASGSGAILDVARGLRRLIDAKRLPAPQRTLRFLWVPEWHGTMAYIDGHEELLGPDRLEGQESTTLANLNLDMVGEDTEKLHSRLILTRSPLAVAGALDAVVGEMAAMVDELDVRTPRGSRATFHWRQTPFSGGSDHMMFLDRGIPSVMFSHDPDYTHHTSEDTPDKVDPVELERCELIAAGAAWCLANLDRRGAAELAWLVGADAMARIDEGARAVRARIEVEGVSNDAVLRQLREADDALVALGALLEGELVHARRFDPAPGDNSRFTHLLQAQREGLRERVQRVRRTLAGEFSSSQPDERRRLRDILAEQKGPAARFVLRRTRGPLAFDLPARELPPERAAWYAADECPFRDSDRRFELLNFANLGLPLGGIRAAYSAEHGPVSEADLERFFEDLQTVGLVVLGDAAAQQPSKD